MTNHERLLWEASKIWAPEVNEENPRRASNATSYQEPVDSRYDLTTSLMDAQDAGKPAFVSTYSFPRGHTDDGQNIPEIDTIFVDFDIPPDSEYREKNQSLNAWKRSMSDLLIRVQMVAQSLLDSGKAKHWRASLSGHKGVHLFFDFDPVHPGNGSYAQFRNALSDYGEGMIEQLDEISGGINIDPWVDVDSSDLARLVRHPNRIHPGAGHVDESWCVPVTIEELSGLTPDEYLELTSGPREIPESTQRVPSSEATDEISLQIRSAEGGEISAPQGTGSVRNASKIKEYRNSANDNISVSDIPLLVSNKPCIMAFVERNDSYRYGNQSRTMEIQVMKELIQKNVPIDVMVNFFRPIDDWNEQYTRRLVEDLISRYDGPFTCKNIWENASEFCVAMNDGSCNVYEREQSTNL
jgi:hypothetical protein